MRTNNVYQPFMFQYQAPATLNQAAPVQNTWYDILPTTQNVRIYDIYVNIEDTNEDLEGRVIIDGETIEAISFTATHSTDYRGQLAPEAIGRRDRLQFVAATGTVNSAKAAFILEGHSVQVQVRKTTAAGVGNLTGIVVYGVLKRV